MKKIAVLFFSICLLFGMPAARALDKPYDHSAWDRFLKEFVNENGAVDYQAAHDHPELLNQYLDQIKSINRFEFDNDWPREERMALWINAYNAGIIKAIIDHYPVKNIQLIPGIWETDFLTVAGRPTGLNKIQKRELIGKFGDEKIHLVLACSGKSCPKLSRDAFTGPKVEGQLFKAAKDFVVDTERNKIVPGDRKIWLSRLFKWYKQDFWIDFGAPTNDRNLLPDDYAVLSFLSHYIDDIEKIKYLEEGNYKVKYLDFDWSLNQWQKTAQPSTEPQPSK